MRIIVLIIILFIILYTIYNLQSSKNENFSWSEKWSKLDFQVRKNNNCNPINIIDMNKYKIWTMPESCEDGLPHTRYKDVIAMPINYSGEYNITIEHELVHLQQRKNLNKFLSFYSKYWNFEQYNKNLEKNIPKKFIENRRSNPDTIDTIWVIFLNKWLVVPIYNNSMTIKNATIIFYNINTKEELEYPPKEWIDFFGETTQPEHPHEISATYIASYIKNNKISSIAMKLLIDRWDFTKKDFIDNI